MSKEVVAILDAGSQYGKVIDRRVRELFVESHIVPLSTSADELMAQYGAIIISGSPDSVNNSDLARFDAKVWTCGLPVLGICFGMQMMAKHFGGEVSISDFREDGQFAVNCDTTSPLFSGLDATQTVLLTHGDFVKSIPGIGFNVISSTSSGSIAGIANTSRRLYALQFHPEVDLTENGMAMLQNFIRNICGFTGRFTISSRLQSCITEIQTAVGNRAVLMLLSGGVDSTVCGALLAKALPSDKLRFIHVDTGFMRKNESSQVITSLRSLGVDVKVIDATVTFANATTLVRRKSCTSDTDVKDARQTCRLCECEDPEDKRRIIGDTFMKVVDEEIAAMGLEVDQVVLGQGTLRPDLIESASSIASVSKKADAIKTHHNDTYLVRRLRSLGRVVEPLKDFHKDEVRELGRQLGLPEIVIMRHPFPGPGLAIRIICATEPFYTNEFHATVLLLRRLFHVDDATDAPSSVAEISRGLSDSERKLFDDASGNKVRLWPTLLPIKSVGVQGDSRSYSHVVALTIDSKQETLDAESWSLLFQLAKSIPKLCKNVNRVVYGWGPAMQGRSFVDSVTPTHLTPEDVEVLREADFRATETLHKACCMDKIAQMPIVLLPVDMELIKSKRRSIVIRPFVTHDFMTGLPALPGKHLPINVVEDMRRSILNLNQADICRVFYDLTAKPPATTEWE